MLSTITALHYASENGHAAAVRTLLELGANPDVLDSRKCKPIDVSKSAEIKHIFLNVPKQNYNKLQNPQIHKRLK